MKLIEQTLTPQFYDYLISLFDDGLLDFFSNAKDQLVIITNKIAGKLEVSELSDTLTYQDLANSIYLMYKTKWSRIFSALSAEYNPIHNYDMIETAENFTQHSSQYESYENFSDGKTGTEKIISANGENASSGKTVNNIEVNENGVSWDYETADMVKNSQYVTTYDNLTGNLNGYDEQQGQSSSIRTNQELHIYDISETKDGTVKNGYDDMNITINSPVSNTSLKPNDFSGNSLKRSGNIGVTRTQQMITDEILLRYRYQIATIIVNDCIDFCSGGVW